MRFLTDAEYEAYFFVLGGMRGAVAGDVAAMVPGASRVLDVASGHGLFAMELARALPSAQAWATGLEIDRRTFRSTTAAVHAGCLAVLPHLTAELLARVRYIVSDVTSLPFRGGSFDACGNFLGLEDVRMTQGESGVLAAIREVARVTRPGGVAEFAVQSFGDEPEDVLSREVQTAIGHGATFLAPEAYEAMMEDAGFRVEARRRYSTGCVLTAKQAEEELRYACEETPKAYGRFGVQTRAFEDLWREFGGRIERHGYALYSNVLAVLARKRS